MINTDYQEDIRQVEPQMFARMEWGSESVKLTSGIDRWIESDLTVKAQR